MSQNVDTSLRRIAAHLEALVALLEKHFECSEATSPDSEDEEAWVKDPAWTPEK